jgi:gas vesicle protein
MRDKCGILPFLLGIAGGVVLGLLVAPKSGEETREELKDRLDLVKGKVGDIYTKGLEKKEELISRGEEFIAKGEELISKGKKKAQDISEDK